eukprot:Clim_evm12s204 gene=Clim_evmTU12s204
MVQEISVVDEFTTVIKGDKLVVVDFYAKWCGPCRVIAPFIEELEKNYPDVVFIKVDVDELEELAAQSGITAMPTFQFYKQGNKIDEVKGARKDALKELVEKHK